jgi:hypothetical protein
MAEIYIENQTKNKIIELQNEINRLNVIIENQEETIRNLLNKNKKDNQEKLL